MAESAPSRTYQRSLSPEQTVGIALALLGTLLLSTKSVIVKSAYAAGSDAEALLAIRMAIALPVYGVIWACLPKGSPLTWREGCSAALIGVLGYGVSSYLDLQGLEYLSASVERLILFTYPLFVAVLVAVSLSAAPFAQAVVEVDKEVDAIFAKWSMTTVVSGNRLHMRSTTGRYSGPTCGHIATPISGPACW